MSVPHCPCRGCHDRKLGCHGFCERYQEWKARNDAVIQQRLDNNASRPRKSRALEYLHRQNMKWR